MKKITIFENILGFDRNTSKSEIIKKLGKPTRHSVDTIYDFNTMYYGEYLSFSYDQTSEKLMNVHINMYGAYLEETLKFIEKKGLDDEKINYLKQHKDQILNEFGKPTLINSDNFIYRTEQIQVTFSCYDHERYLCVSFSVQFFVNE